MAKLNFRRFVFGFIFMAFNFANQVQASTLQDAPIKDGFARRFAIDRNAQGEVVAVRSKNIITSFSLIPFLKLLLEHISQIPRNQKELQSGAYQQQVNETINQLYASQIEDGDKTFGENPEEPTKEERIEKLRNSLENLPKMELRPLIEKLVNDPDLKEFESKLPDLLAKLRPDILSRPGEPKFFFNKPYNRL